MVVVSVVVPAFPFLFLLAEVEPQSCFVMDLGSTNKSRMLPLHGTVANPGKLLRPNLMYECRLGGETCLEMGEIFVQVKLCCEGEETDVEDDPVVDDGPTLPFSPGGDQTEGEGSQTLPYDMSSAMQVKWSGGACSLQKNASVI